MKKIIPIIFSLIIIICVSFWIAYFTYATDFPVFYNAAHAILDGKSVYDVDMLRHYQSPESIRNGAFIYSMPIAYLLSPLALFPYYTAKAIIIFLSILCYFISIAIVLKMNHARERWFLFSLLLASLFPPFIQDIRHAQVNCIMLFLIVVSVYFAVNNLPRICGAILALAALFKIFPIAIAMTLGLKNHRIITTFIAVFVLSFLVPGSLEWIPAIGNIYNTGYVPLFLLLGPFGFLLYGLFIAGLTALIVYRTSKTDYPLYATFSISAAFLMMPLLEFYQLVIMIMPYIFLLTWEKKDRLHVVALMVSFLLISAPFYFKLISALRFINLELPDKALIIQGLAFLWGVLAWKIAKMK